MTDQPIPGGLHGTFGMRGTTFRDANDRHVILRGVNLGGDTKLPATPNQPTYVPTDFSDHRSVSFVGRPAPLDELDSHLDRLRHWGFNCLRLLTTWEAVEHGGPGLYDEAYLDYYAEVCQRAGARGLYVFVDFHQDAWSRMSGGSGAPGWTFEAAGLDLSKFRASGAAHVMQYEYDPAVGGRQPNYPVMSWSGNYARPANGIMWTLFYAGRDFAPSLLVDGENIQDYLQGRYLGAMRAVAERVHDLDNVIGFDTLNEPATGYIGKNLDETIVRYRGPVWTALGGLALASGLSCELPVVAPGRGVVGTQRLNDAGVSIWMPGHEDPFRAAGAWDIRDGAPIALDNAYFKQTDGRVVEFGRDYMGPFFHRVADTVRAIKPSWIIFAETDPFETIQHGLPINCPPNTANAAHWYDFPALITKSFSTERRVQMLTNVVHEGAAAIEGAYVAEMTMLKRAGDNLPGGAPTLLGECGIQYDMNEAQAYQQWTDGKRDPSIWAAQTTALDLMYNAIDRLLLSSTQWNYTATNRNDPMIGDGWNQEDLSIWSLDQVAGNDEPGDGGRAISGFCRPYVRAAQGTIVSQQFDSRSGRFVAVIDIDPAIVEPTEIYVPVNHYPEGRAVVASGGADTHGTEQTLYVKSNTAGRITIEVTRP